MNAVDAVRDAGQFGDHFCEDSAIATTTSLGVFKAPLKNLGFVSHVIYNRV